MIISGRMQWVGHVAHLQEMHTEFWLENLKGRDHSYDLGINERWH